MSEISEYWRPNRPHDGSNMSKHLYRDIPSTRLFDNLWFVGNDLFGAYILRTSEGLILLDSMHVGFFDYLDKHICDTGLDPHDLRAILITHGHADHYGDADKLREKYGAKLYMTQVDEDYAHSQKNVPHAKFYLTYQMDGHLTPGENFVLGDTQVEIHATPGHTPGTASFVLPVCDCGRPHRLMLWGGTGPSRSPEMLRTQLNSVDRFDRVCFEEGVDGEISNHPFTDNLVQRMDTLRALVNGVSHPLIVGRDGVHQMLMMYRAMYAAALEKHSKEEASR